MEWVSPSEQPYFLSHPPPVPTRSLQSGGFSKVSPNILIVIVILAVLFFVSALLHLLVRFLLRPPYRDPEEADNVTGLQGQLQQLFHLHDAGVDQSFIDTLPVFHYKAITGSKTPFDCAVCLCEFEPDDKLRLLPKCSHAFHMECIDTWLLSNSTCPLCRASLLPDLSPNTSCSLLVYVVESGSESSSDSCHHHGDSEIAAIDECVPAEKVVAVKLGKFRNVDVGGEGSSGKNVDERRCFSMGSFEYVMDDKSVLQVPIRTPMSECDRDSRREFSGFEAVNGRSKRESFSVSKTWLRGEKDQRKLKAACHIGRWENGGTELDENRPSFARKTLLWVVARQNKNKVVHSSFSP